MPTQAVLKTIFPPKSPLPHSTKQKFSGLNGFTPSNIHVNMEVFEQHSQLVMMVVGSTVYQVTSKSPIGVHLGQVQKFIRNSSLLQGVLMTSGFGQVIHHSIT